MLIQNHNTKLLQQTNYVNKRMMPVALSVISVWKLLISAEK